MTEREPGVIANLELAPMNEKLGSYFGTSRGVLVISAPEEQNLGLIPGDVMGICNVLALHDWEHARDIRAWRDREGTEK